MAAVQDLAAADQSAERLTRGALAPVTPAHVAYAFGKGSWAFPVWLQYVNRRIVEFLLQPGQQFLIIEVPVRHGKSRFIGTEVAAWFVGMFPDAWVQLTSYSDTLARRAGRRARQIIRELGPEMFGVEVDPTSNAADEWMILGRQGGMTSVPMGGTITGSGGDLAVIDDPYRGAKEANNPRVRADVQEWYHDTFRNRLGPNGKMILVMSRWHADDLSGHLQHNQTLDDTGDQFDVIHLPALAQPHPSTKWADPEHGWEPERIAEWTDEIGRHVGEALWPERWGEDRLRQVEAGTSPYSFAANFQQSPMSRGGEKFPREKWRHVWLEDLPTKLDLVRRWDLGGADSDADWTATALLGRDRDGLTYVLDVNRGHWSDADREETIEATARDDRVLWGDRALRGILYRIEQEPGQGGKTLAESIANDTLAAYTAEAKTSVTNKVDNAGPFAGQVQRDRVFLLGRTYADGSHGPAPWWQEFIDETELFPRAAHDDMVDAASHAYNDLADRSRSRRKKPGRARSAANR